MHPTRNHRFVLSIASLFALLVGVTACSSGPSIAATVGGTEITTAEVEQAYARRAESPVMASELATESDVDIELQAAVLTTLIRTEILRKAAEDRGVEVTDDEISAQRDTLVENAGGQEALDQAMADNNVSDEELESNLIDQAIQAEISSELASEVTDEQVRAAYSEDPQGQYGEKVEVRHILTETEAEAQEAIDRIKSGEDFADVARDMSQDPGSAQQGGELGPIARGTTVEEFDEAAFSAEVGELVGPIETQFGFHVLEVTRHISASEFPEVEDNIRTQLQSTAQVQAFSDFIIGFIEELEVEVDPAYGTWDAQSVSVIPRGPSESPSSVPQQPLPTSLPTSLPTDLPT